jgi:hypothetical protein
MTIGTNYDSYGLYGSYSPCDSRDSGAARASRTPTANDLSSDPAEKARARDEATLKEFRDYMHMTPQQRMRQAILKELGLSEEQLHALPPEQQEAVETEIGKRMRMKLVGQIQDGNPNAQSSLDELAGAP